MSVGTPVTLGATSNVADAASYTLNTNAVVPAGALVVVCVYWLSDTTAQTVTLSGGGLTWTEDQANPFTDGTNQAGCSIFSAPAPSGLANPTTLTATMTSAAVTTINIVIAACYIPGAIGKDVGAVATDGAPANSNWASG